MGDRLGTQGAVGILLFHIFQEYLYEDSFIDVSVTIFSSAEEKFLVKLQFSPILLRITYEEKRHPAFRTQLELSNCNGRFSLFSFKKYCV